MRRIIAPIMVIAAATASLVSCAATPKAPPTPSSIESTTTEPSPSTDESPQLVVGINGVTYIEGADTASAQYDDAAALLALLTEATGELPTPTEIEDPPGYEMDKVAYDWEGLKVITDAGGTGAASISVSGPEVDGVPIATEEGLSVGSSRADLSAANGWDQWDEDGDGTADYVGLGGVPVPGTTSLAHPGEVGILFLLFVLDGDTVVQIMAPSNDFSDL
ncbi:hypothetical protein GCM10009651_16410 [Microbacterium natoriense]|nr:hypothetical protein CQ047_01855 [Microbacterium sp. MYb72]